MQRMIAAVFFLALSTCSPAGGNEGGGGSADKPETKIVLWTEIYFSSDSATNASIAGMNEWLSLTDTIIVSIGASKSAFFAKLKVPFPTLNIIPSLKTSPMFGHCGFDSVEVWRRMATHVRVACDGAGKKQMLFENESALKKYYDGECAINLNELRKGLKLLPKDIEYLWYPSAAGDGEMLQRYIRLNRVVDEVLNVRFIDHVSLNAPQYVGGRETLRAAAALEEAATLRTIPVIYCCGEKWWPFDRIPEALRYAEKKWGKDSWSILYPGNSRCISAARAIRKALKEQATISKP